jgi:hypothetical protein
VQLEFNENTRDFLYGVSAVSEEGSSGLEWQECVYSKHKGLSFLEIKKKEQKKKPDRFFQLSFIR